MVEGEEWYSPPSNITLSPWPGGFQHMEPYLYSLRVTEAGENVVPFHLRQVRPSPPHWPPQRMSLQRVWYRLHWGRSARAQLWLLTGLYSSTFAFDPPVMIKPGIRK